MQPHLLDPFDPWKLAAAGGHLQGEVRLEHMPRLGSLLAAAAGPVTVTLEAGVDAHPIAFLTGHLEVTVRLVCQRCLAPMALPLNVPFRLGLVQCEAQAERLPEGYEPLLVPEDGLVTSGWVEDELLLALPLVPLHSDLYQCEAQGFTWPQSAPRVEQSSPFARLSALLKDPK